MRTKVHFCVAVVDYGKSATSYNRIVYLSQEVSILWSVMAKRFSTSDFCVLMAESSECGFES